MKSIVLTGATSMIGIALIKECIENHTEVLAIVRKNSPNLYRIPDSKYVKILECNLEDLHTLDAGKGDYEVFYHFAWEHTGRANRDNAVCQNKNISYTLDAVSLAERMGCTTFVGAGSQAEYGRVEALISPDTLVNPDIAYGVAKYAAGKLSRLQCRDIGLKHIWTRVFSVYGPYDNKDTMVMYSIRMLLLGEKPSYTKSEQLWDYMYCGDTARAFYAIGEKGKDRSVYCIGNGNTKVLSEYITIIKDCINTELPIGIGEKEYSVNQVMHLCADISSLTTDTGFQPVISFNEGICNTIEWYRKEYNIV